MDTLNVEYLLTVGIEVPLAAVLVALVERPASGLCFRDGIGHFRDGIGYFRPGRTLFLARRQPSSLFLLLSVRQLLGLEAECARAVLARVGEQGSDGHILCVASAVAGDVGGIHSLGNNFAVVDQDAADGRFVDFKGEAGLVTLARGMHEKGSAVRDVPYPEPRR